MLTPTSLILVCLLPSPRDLEIARLLGWYRIPFKSAPKVVAVDYLAFYQPASFGEGSGQIQYTAQVRGHDHLVPGTDPQSCYFLRLHDLVPVCDEVKRKVSQRV